MKARILDIVPDLEEILNKGEASRFQTTFLLGIRNLLEGIEDSRKINLHYLGKDMHLQKVDITDDTSYLFKNSRDFLCCDYHSGWRLDQYEGVVSHDGTKVDFRNRNIILVDNGGKPCKSSDFEGPHKVNSYVGGGGHDCNDNIHLAVRGILKKGARAFYQISCNTGPDPAKIDVVSVTLDRNKREDKKLYIIRNANLKEKK